MAKFLYDWAIVIEHRETKDTLLASQFMDENIYLYRKFYRQWQECSDLKIVQSVWRK